MGTVPKDAVVPVPRETFVSDRANAIRAPIEMQRLGATDTPVDEMTKFDYL